MKRIAIFTVLVMCISLAGLVTAQENAQTRIAQSLEECYQNLNVFERDNRLPMTTNMLIELIRKAEDAPEHNMDMRQMAIALVHRFRQDGILRAAGVQHTQSFVLPFSPLGFQFSKHRILMSRLVPGNAFNFPNETLSVQERCALHFMMSSSIETQVRGDENVRCSQLAQYRSQRLPREIDHSKRKAHHLRNNYIGDVEVMADRSSKVKKGPKFGKLEDGEYADEEEAPADGDPETEAEEAAAADDEDGEELMPNVDFGLVDVASSVLVSACPVENGVVSTRWGAVAAGPLITGLAAGLEPQQVQARELLALSRSGQYRARQQGPLTIDNRFAATLAGDLGEVALLQGPIATGSPQVGAPGAWNSSAIPRWFFLSQRERLEQTDAEIRGGLDGLILADGIAEWRRQAPSLRLSQVLDMYYSHRGVFGQNTRACNRRALFTQVAPIEMLRAQTTAFSTVLDREMQLRVTLQPQAISAFSEASANALASYIPAQLNDPSCVATLPIPIDETNWRSAVDLFIYVDRTWPFMQINPVVAHLLEGLDVNRFGTTYTLMNAQDGTVIVNTTNQMADLYVQWNQTTHDQHPVGFHFPNIMNNLRPMMRQFMDMERTTSSQGGRSKIALLIPELGAITEADGNFVFEQQLRFREEFPDLRFIIFTGGLTTRFHRFVREESRDIFPLRPPTNVGPDSVQTQTNPVVIRIQQEPRRIINHRCGANWEQMEWGESSFNQYVEPNGVVFYRVHPNYFFHAGGGRRLRVQGHGYPGGVTVCHSRDHQWPRMNSTVNNDGMNCRHINGESFDIDLSNACEGVGVIHQCRPLFVSVAGPVTTPEGATFRCVDTECRFPDNLRFAFISTNFGCFSGAGQLIASLTLIIASIMIAIFKF